MRRLLRFAAAARQRGRRQDGGRKKRRRHQRAADFLHHHAGLDAAKSAAAEILGDQETGKPHFGKRLPELAGKPRRVLAVAQLPQMRHRRLVADKAARAVAQHGLFFGEDECHGKLSILSDRLNWLSSSCPALRRASTSCFSETKTWMAGSSPAMTAERNQAPGRSRMRLATIPSITSLVPPSIELALVRSQARGRAPFLERSLSHSSASAPPADIRIS